MTRAEARHVTTGLLVPLRGSVPGLAPLPTLRDELARREAAVEATEAQQREAVTHALREKHDGLATRTGETKGGM